MEMTKSMRFYWIFIFIVLILGCKPTKQIFNSGTVTSTNSMEVIDIFFINNLPFCNVEIGGVTYTFLIDTGAPTVISEEIYERLGLKVIQKGEVSDSQKSSQIESFAQLPALKMGNLTFNDIGCVVINFENSELKCFIYDGIIGANLLAKMYVEFDYSNTKIVASNSITSFNTDNYNFALHFKPKIQKTPLIKGKVLSKPFVFTFDTGFTGNIDVPNTQELFAMVKSSSKYITSYGINSSGLYGRSAEKQSISFKSDLQFDGQILPNEIIESGNSALIGNNFLKDFRFLIDWNKHMIYFKKNEDTKEKEISGFGIKYLFNDGKAIVVSKIENTTIPVNLGDQIIKINEVNFTNLTQNEICEFLINRVEKGQKKIKVSVKRNDKVLQFELNRVLFLK